ncbi:Hypothetical predicted protein [Marmota monax]|uniref:Uncharacterized protein n=1 Tax=Marmota monax TaxID=9995 RepID=A0A5E4B3W8_MARMO|nr:hypothetical protein GHT09_002233 [Marmota monax]VTJ63766.1 Hypothetical predicted protein [Marmota monax]
MGLFPSFPQTPTLVLIDPGRQMALSQPIMLGSLNPELMDSTASDWQRGVWHFSVHFYLKDFPAPPPHALSPQMVGPAPELTPAPSCTCPWASLSSDHRSWGSWDGGHTNECIECNL